MVNINFNPLIDVTGMTNRYTIIKGREYIYEKSHVVIWDIFVCNRCNGG